MAKRKRSSKRRTYKAPARRTTAKRRAPSRKRQAVKRRAKRNPKSPLDTPAVKYGASALVGAGLGTALNTRPDLFGKMGTDWASGAGGYSPAIMAAIATLIGGHFLLKGKNRQLAYAAGIGMAIPAGAAKIGESVSGLIAAKNGNGNGKISTTTKASAMRALPKYYAAPTSKRASVVSSTSKMKAV
tara:strand:- start:2831 stop:3388 length:558 start_codon:yes stop_codon:yes gene_type:complete